MQTSTLLASEEATLSLEVGSESIDAALLNFLEKSKKLEFLDLQTHLSASTLECIYQWQQDYKLGGF